MKHNNDKWIKAIKLNYSRLIKQWLNTDIPEDLSYFLKIAIEQNANEIIEIFLKYIPEWIKRFSSETLIYTLFETIKTDNMKIMESLIKSGCPVNEKITNYENSSDYHETPLIYAVRLNKVKAAKILLENRANANIIGMKAAYDDENEELLPLHIAIKNNNIDLVKLLLQNGAKTNLTTREESGRREFYISFNKTALDLANINENEQIKNLLIKYGAKQKQ